MRTNNRIHILFFSWIIMISFFINCSDKKDEEPVIHQGEKYRFGMNFDYVSPWDTQIVFVDLMKQANTWNAYQLQSSVYQTKIQDSGITLDSKGYPNVSLPFDDDNDPSTYGYVVNATICTNIGSNYPAGEYTLIFKGKGKISLEWDAGISPEKGYSATPRQFSSTGEEVTNTVTVVPNIGIQIQIDESDSNDPVREIRLIMPGYESTYLTNPFYSPFISKLKGFEILRILNLVHTNDIKCDNPLHEPSNRTLYKECKILWSNRISTNYYTQLKEGRGMAWEYVIDIVNQVENASIWINIPHAATMSDKDSDNYIRELARLLKTRLSSDRKIYIEWSNEVYNTGTDFPQHMWYQDNGENIFPNDELEIASEKYFVQGLLKIFKIFKEEFAGEENRLVRVLTGQQGNNDKTQRLLNNLQDESINPGKEEGIDVYSIGAYFGWSLLSDFNNVPSADSLIASARNDISEYIKKSAKETKSAIDSYRTTHNISQPISLIAYEGGQHMVPMDMNWNYLHPEFDNVDFSNYNAANRGKTIYKVYREWADAWFTNGGDMIIAFSYVTLPPQNYIDASGETRLMGTTTFGHLEHLNQNVNDAPKYCALLDMMDGYISDTCTR